MSRKYVPKHIKFMFVFRPRITRKNIKGFQYFIVLATDDNEIYFEQLQFAHEKKALKKTVYEYLFSRLKQVVKFVWAYNIDGETEVLFSTYEKFYIAKDFYFQLFKMFSSLFGFRIGRRKIEEIFTSVRKFHKFDLKCFHRIYPWQTERRRFWLFTRNVNIWFRGMMQNRVCPWINPEMEMFLDNLSRAKKQIYKFTIMGLWFMVIRQYLRIRQGIDLERWMNHIDVDMSDFTKFMMEQNGVLKIYENILQKMKAKENGEKEDDEDEENDLNDDFGLDFGEDVN